ncbi:MAG: hypothetical protein OXI53_05670, partial [Nitrospira sp.]|nr:hypothetical protein [Nitrospira sp.]
MAEKDAKPHQMRQRHLRSGVAGWAASGRLRHHWAMTSTPTVCTGGAASRSWRVAARSRDRARALAASGVRRQ